MSDTRPVIRTISRLRATSEHLESLRCSRKYGVYDMAGLADAEAHINAAAAILRQVVASNPQPERRINWALWIFVAAWAVFCLNFLAHLLMR